MKRLIADVIHKIKNGLGGIGGYATLLEKELSTDDPKLRFVHKINDGVISVNEIAVKLMSLVRIRELQKEKIKIEYLFREILKNISDNDDELINKLNFDKTFKEKYIEINSDQEVISELFKNSIQFIQEINGIIKEIKVNPLDKGKISIHIFFYKNYSDGENFSLYINNLMHDARNIYARLCFAITTHMMELLHGKYSTITSKDGSSILKLEL